MKRKERGITLVALVVTIIILLILAGVAIRTVTADNGLFSKARIAKEESEIAEIIDSAKMDVLAKQTEKLETTLTEKELKEILDKYGELSDKGEETILDKTIRTDKGSYDIAVRRIYDGNLAVTASKLSCTIEGKVVNYDNGMIWNTDFLNSMSGVYYDYDEGREEVTVYDILKTEGQSNYWGEPESSEDKNIICAYLTSQAFESYLWAVDADGNELGAVHYDDPVLPGARYYWNML